MPSLVDITGKRFGRLVVTGESNRCGYRRYWTCKCDCGEMIDRRHDILMSGRATECRKCIYRRISKICTTHGMSESPEYRIWEAMHQRCSSPKYRAFARYGGRGISVCQEWCGPGGFDAFFKHIGKRPTKRHSLDRIDNNGNYEPNNVRWASPSQQHRNTCSNHYVTLNGTTRTIIEWSELLGIKANTIHGRLKSGWSIVRALSKI